MGSVCVRACLCVFVTLYPTLGPRSGATKTHTRTHAHTHPHTHTHRSGATKRDTLEESAWKVDDGEEEKPLPGQVLLTPEEKEAQVMHTRTHAHTRTHVRAHTHTRACVRARTHTHTHTFTCCNKVLEICDQLESLHEDEKTGLLQTLEVCVCVCVCVCTSSQNL